MALHSIILKYSEKDKLKLISEKYGITIKDLLINEAKLILTQDMGISTSKPIPKHLRVSYSINIEDNLKQQIKTFCNNKSVKIKDFLAKCIFNTLTEYKDFLDSEEIWAEYINPYDIASFIVADYGLLKAIDVYEMQIQEQPQNSTFYTELGSIYLELYDFEEAKRIYKLANKNIKSDYDLQRRLENIEYYLKNGSWKYDFGVSEDKTKPENHRNIVQGKALLKEGNKKDGIELLESAIENKSLVNTAYYTLYQTYKKDKQYDDAIRVCDKAIENLGFFSKERYERWTEIKNKTITQKKKEMAK